MRPIVRQVLPQCSATLRVFGATFKTQAGKISKCQVFTGFLVFLVAIVVRLLTQQDNLLEAGKVQSTVVEFYRQFARFIVQDGFRLFST